MTWIANLDLSQGEMSSQVDGAWLRRSLMFIDLTD